MYTNELKPFDGSYLSHFIYKKLTETSNIEKHIKELKKARIDNKYFIKTELLNYLDNLSRSFYKTIKKGSVFYRARIIKNNLPNELQNYHSFLNTLTNKYISAINEKNITNKKLSFIIKCIEDNDLSDICDNNNPNNDLFEQYADYANKKRNVFFGYYGEDAGAPPKGKSGENRANSKGMSVLYLSQNEETAIWEVNPKVKELVSVAEFELLQDITVFDVTYPKSYDEKMSDDEIRDRIALSYYFSLPHDNSEDFYFITQYISEYISQLEFDGIYYSSSLDNEENLTLFNYSNNSKLLSLRNSKVYIIESPGKYECILPIPLYDDADDSCSKKITINIIYNKKGVKS